jgi:predicted PurR-regulated permease PerM
MIGPFLLAIATGGILALMTKPVFRNLIERGLSPKSASALVTLGIVLLVIVPASICAGLAVKQGITIGRIVTSSENYSFHAIIDKISSWAPVEMIGISPAEVDAKAREWIQSGIKIGTTTVIGIAAYVPNIILQLVLASIACFFLLIDGSGFVRWIGDKIPLDEDVSQRVVESFKNMAIASIWATLTASIAQSIVIFIGYISFGIPGAFLAGGATFVLAWIPVVGSTPVWTIGAFYLYTQDSTSKAIAMVILGLIAGIIDNVIRPIVLKGRSDMHPLISLVAIIGGIGLFGILGVFFGPIVTAVLISLLQIWPAVAARFGLVPLL